MDYKKISHLEYANADLETYNIIRNQNCIEEINYNGIEISIFPNVFSPKYFTDSYWFAEEVSEIVKGKSFLEIGSGTGIISLLSRLKGAKITCTDINPDAVKNTKHNLEKHKLSGECLQSDLFEALDPNLKFDYIFWNHPFFESDQKVDDILLRAGFDYRYEGLERYLTEGHKHLNPNGSLLLGTGNAARLERLEEICLKNGLSTELLRTTVMPVNPGSELVNDYRIYNIGQEATSKNTRTSKNI